MHFIEAYLNWTFISMSFLLHIMKAYLNWTFILTTFSNAFPCKSCYLFYKRIRTFHKSCIELLYNMFKDKMSCLFLNFTTSCTKLIADFWIVLCKNRLKIKKINRTWSQTIKFRRILAFTQYIQWKNINNYLIHLSRWKQWDYLDQWWLLSIRP